MLYTATTISLTAAGPGNRPVPCWLEPRGCCVCCSAGEVAQSVRLTLEYEGDPIEARAMAARLREWGYRDVRVRRKGR